jgi:deferrochelatase/peroxidase EfeB
VTPFVDDPALGNDADRNNNFNFSDATDGVRCPFSAHIRKTNPRADLGGSFNNHIKRSGIPYGPEVTDDENSSNTSGDVERGLAFGMQLCLLFGCFFQESELIFSFSCLSV